MKKKFFASVLSALLLIVTFLCGLVGCGGVENSTSPDTSSAVEKSISLDVTAKELTVGESFTLNATTNPEDAIVVWSSSNDAVAIVNDGAVSAISAGTATITAKNDTATATCTVTVSEAVIEKYTVVFMNGETKVREMQVDAGATASYVGAIPAKTATEQYSYTFSGWALTEGGEAVDLATVTVNENKTFYAIFVESVREYSVSWNIDGVVTSETLAYGAVPEYKGTTPGKPTVGNTSYTFIGWSAVIGGEVLQTIPAVTGNATYYAVFDEVTAQTKFTVTWKNGESLLKTDENVEYDTVPAYVGETPVKEATVESEFVFAGWASSIDGAKLEELPVVTADVTYYAVFEATPRMYTITWMIEGEEKTSQCAYGSVPAFNGTPEKADSEICSFKFIGWALTEGGAVEETLPQVSGVATYYAVFDVDQIFESPKFVGGKIEYSANSQEIFMPDGLLGEGVTLVKAVLKKTALDRVVVYENDVWAHDVITLTEEELKGNLIGTRALEVELSNGEKYSVDMNVYAGIIDELSDFPKFFNNTAVPSEYDAATYPAVAPNVYGYYIVTKDLGTGVEELSFEQVEATDYQKTNGFNGVLDGQGHTLRFKLMKGGLVGLVLGNAVIKNLGVIYEDATSTYYGVFGYITNGSPEIRNCYIERTNNHYQAWSVFGIMSRPNAKLILHNTVVYGYNTSNASEKNGKMWISEASTNAYIIHARANATWVNVQNFTKVFKDAVEDGSREVVLSEIEDASGFDDNYWAKENGKLIWKGIETVTVTWVKGEETVTETLTKGDWIMYTQTLPENTDTPEGTTSYYWSKTEDGAKVNFSDRFRVDDYITYYMVTKFEARLYTVIWNIDGVETEQEYAYGEQIAHEDVVKEEDNYFIYEFKGWATSEDGEIVELGTAVEDGIVYYAVFEKTSKVVTIAVKEPMMFSTDDSMLFFPEEVKFGLDSSVKIASPDGAVVYYENGVWANSFAITDAQRNANAIATFDVVMEKGTEIYVATVKSYAGVIDELSDFPAFFNNEGVVNTNPNNAADYPIVAPSVYGYYIVIKDLGTGVEELTFTQEIASNFTATCGFNGVLDGMGHTLKFKLMEGGLLGLILGNATIKNLAIIYADETAKQYGVFGYMTSGNPVIENCYIERTNNKYQKWSVFGIMSRPNARLTLHNTVVYGYNTSTECAMNSYMWISANSTNAYLIHARSGATGWLNVQNFTKVFNDGIENGAREVALSEIADASGFNGYWNKEDGKLTWKGASNTAVSSVVKVA